MQNISREQLDAIRKQGFRPQVLLCFLFEKQVLFGFTEEYDLWSLPQGGVKNGELLEEAALREAREELGETFAATIQGVFTLLGQDRIEFPPDKHGIKDLHMDNGESVTMIGKVYFVLALEVPSRTLELEESEFTDVAWMDAPNADALAGTIYQRGKRRVTRNALRLLKEQGLL